jgi:hypothetical protein
MQGSSIETLILRGLVRKLIAKNLISTEDLRAILFEAAAHQDVVGGRQTPEAAQIAVEEDLLPAFLGRSSP